MDPLSLFLDFADLHRLKSQSMIQAVFQGHSLAGAHCQNSTLINLASCVDSKPSTRAQGHPRPRVLVHRVLFPLTKAVFVPGLAPELCQGASAAHLEDVCSWRMSPACFVFLSVVCRVSCIYIKHRRRNVHVEICRASMPSCYTLYRLSNVLVFVA